MTRFANYDPPILPPDDHPEGFRIKKRAADPEPGRPIEIYDYFVQSTFSYDGTATATTKGTGVWLVQSVGAEDTGVRRPGDFPGGGCKMLLGETLNDYVQLSLNGDAFDVGQSGVYPFWYETVLRASNPDDMGYAFGLGAEFTLMTTEVDNGVGFVVNQLDGVTVTGGVRFFTAKDGSVTYSPVLYTADGNFKNYAISWDGKDTYRGYIEGELVAIHTGLSTFVGRDGEEGSEYGVTATTGANVVDDDYLKPIYECQVLGDALASDENADLYISYVYCRQKRPDTRN